MAVRVPSNTLSAIVEGRIVRSEKTSRRSRREDGEESRFGEVLLRKGASRFHPQIRVANKCNNWVFRFNKRIQMTLFYSEKFRLGA